MHMYKVILHKATTKKNELEGSEIFINADNNKVQEFRMD